MILRKTGEKNKNDKILMLAHIIRLCSIAFLLPSIWVAIFEIRAGEIYPFSCALIFIFAAIAACCLMTCQINWIVCGKCDVQAYEKFLRSLLRRKGYQENVKLHIELLITSLVLGKYDESRQEIDVLQRLNGKSKPVQRLNVQLFCIDYMIAMNETSFLNEALENAENALLMLNVKNDRIKQKFQRGIKHRRYLIEERWEDLLELLKESSPKKMTIYEQVNNAYYYGGCCYHLGRYEEAFEKLKFVAEYGGNTKYVALANELIEKIPEKNLYENKSAGQSKKVKHRINKTVIIFAVSCILFILSIGFNRYCSYGNSIEEAYCRRYFCTEDDLTILYQNKIDDYELVILYDEENEKNVAYCLFDVTDSGYKMVDSHRLYINFAYYGKQMGSEKELYQESETSLDIRTTLNRFYKKNNIFYQEDMKYVGICLFPIAENAVVNGNPVSVEQVIYIDETSVYLWSVENVDLKTNIQVEYIAE